ncbi:glycosyltransferase family 4 protein [Coleofasciculus sp.]|uniref:glycosyltransferase family 4 protein n=1 Tax=Coleofasciculus sp. TaxID=3100458 RepID=UPI0039FB2634
MSDKVAPWICCQLGAREHYAIPRALHQHGKLTHLITDAWVLPQSPLNVLPRHNLANLRDRFHPDLAPASVHAFTHSLIRFELVQRLQNTLGWTRIIARNHLFQQRAVELLESITPKLNTRPILFAYSYAALELFRYAKTQGWYTILGQIDPGPVEETLVRQEHHRHPDYQSNWQPAPPEYWINWRKECFLADRIIVNSPWSSQALQKVGIPANKMDIIPLVYTPPETASTLERTYPAAFSAQRPLRVLFLGQVILRKGIGAILEAAELLHDQPIEFWFVGSPGIARSARIYRNIKWIGAISRSQTANYYQLADVFLFPTLSDGFGLVQLEAQAWKLPIIASRFCGEVVKDQVNGIILPEVTGEAIALAIEFCLRNPQKLQAFTRSATDISKFNLSPLYNHLQSLSYAFI